MKAGLSATHPRNLAVGAADPAQGNERMTTMEQGFCRGFLVTALFGATVLASPTVEGMSGMAMRSLCAEAPAGNGDKAVAAAERRAGEAAFAQRKDWGQAAAAIDHFEKSLAADADQPDVRLLVSRAYYLFADGKYRFDEEDDKQLDAFKKGALHAARAVRGLNPAFVRKVCGNAPADEAVAALDRRTVPAAYWFMTHLGKYGLAKDLLEVLANKDMIFAVMATSKRLAPGYFHYAPDRYLGAYYTKVPFPKGDMPKAFEQFRLSMRGAPGYLATYNLAAELYATRASRKIDRRASRCVVGAPLVDADSAVAAHPCRLLFQKLLEHVLQASADQLPDLEAEQLIEKEKAKRLLEDIDTYFPPD